MRLFENRKEMIIVVLLLLVSGISHATNMYGFPYYENDEGNYMAQAWSIISQGKLAPYTYWYDHAPLGWILIAIWVQLTGGFFTFGPSVNSGRVLMLLLHLATTFFLYFIAKRISGKKEVGVLSVLIYSFSPLGIYYQRRVLLDNIMTFWVFAGIYMVTLKNLRLSSVVLSSVFFGLSILSKENAIFFLPLFLFLIYTYSSHTNRKFGMAMFLTVSASVVSLYALYAILKKEFFPVGFLGNSTQHVSLLETLSWHATRGETLPFWEKGSDFYGGFREWMNKDAVMVIMGTGAFLIGAIISIFKKEFRAPVLFSLLFTLFLVRGGLIIGFYIVPLIPIFALLISQVLFYIVGKLSFGKKNVYNLLINLSFIAVPLLLLTNHNGQYTRNETNPQVEALDWVKSNVSEDSYIVIDNYMYVDLNEPGYMNSKVYPNADWFWKIYYDTEIREGKYQNDFRKIEYVTLSHEMLKQIKEGTQEYLKETMKNSTEVKRWTQSTTSYLDFDNYISTNGDWMSIFKRESLEDIYLVSSWNEYKAKYIHSYGQVVDPSNGRTTSEGQSYAMLRAVWMGDKDTFDGVWNWTRDHMQHRGSDMLLSWLWGKDEDGVEKVLDSNAASDADEDIALSLIFASKQFDDQRYLLEAISILRDIWTKEVVEVNGKLLFLSSPSSEMKDGYLTNPSYFSPASYKIFAEVDPAHDWLRLSDDTYYFLNLIATDPNNKIKLPPNWVLVNSSGEITSASEYITGDPDYYGFDAFRALWRVALDEYWFGSKEAESYLTGVGSFLKNQWKDKTKISAIYTQSGTPMVSYSTPSTTVGALSTFLVTDKLMADELFKREYYNIVYGKDQSTNENYYDQNWVWLGSALYLDKLPNLWVKL